MRRVMRGAATGTARFAAVACMVSGMACGPAAKNREIPILKIPAGAMAANWKQTGETKRIPSCVDYFDFHLAHSKAETRVRNSCHDKLGFDKKSCLIEGMMNEYRKEDSEIYHYPVSVVLKKGDKIPNMHLKGMTVDEPHLFTAKIVEIKDKGALIRIMGSGICIKKNKDDAPYDVPEDFEITEMIPFGAIANPGFPHMPLQIFSLPCTMWDPTMHHLEWKNVRLEKAGSNKAVLRYDERRPSCTDAGNQKGNN